MTDDGGWTDANGNDPGITILEVVAYTLAAAGVAAFVAWRTRRRRRLSPG